MAVIQQTTTKNHGSDTSVLSHIKHIIVQRKCMLNTQALRLRLQWCPQAKCTKRNLIISFVNTKNTQNKLRKLKSKSPKQFWKILNNLQSKKENKDISINDLCNFFKDINSRNDSHDPESEHLNFSIDIDDEILNGYISGNDILKCINNFKNNKACSNDGIINEYIKATAHEMMPLYVAFFNLIFNSGVLPDSWLEGAIRPIYKTRVIQKVQKITGQ